MGPRSPVTIVLFLVLCSVRAIRVPIDWKSDSAVTNEKLTADVEIVSEADFPSSNTPAPIPVEYFQYPAKKPQFAVDVAKFHGVKNPENHYSSYPIHPYTGVEKPILGKHKILDENNPVFHQFQQYTKGNDDGESSDTPSSSEYEVFHPYEAEKPALQEIYKDPVLEKIRNDIYNSQSRLQKYEKDAGEPDIQDGEYLESPEQTDRKKYPHKNVPVPYEVHRPQRRPIYYRPSPYYSRDHYLNHRFRHPLNQYNAKIRPLHYRPLKSHLQRLRQNHAMKYDDERNEYPQVPTYEAVSEIPDGYDIYERGKEKYVALRNNVDESINKAVKQNHPAIYQRLELQNNGDRTETQIGDDDEEFIPIKNYAQVRKTETTKHVPKIMAFEDADNFDEIKNAPRLREAIKSTKAQTVYTEEGYEDAAYDHEGEEKHAAENEAHGGHLTEKEISGGKYKAPSVSQNYEDAGGYEHRDQILHGQKWKDNNKDKEEEAENEDYSEDETAHSIETDVYDDITGGRDKRQNESENKKETNNENDETEIEKTEGDDVRETVERSKRENKIVNNALTEINEANNKTNEHDANKRATDFKVPEINLNSTYLTAAELLEKVKIKELPNKVNIKDKYPYYFNNLKDINKNSPLRYAENLKFIPKKTVGGTEFYDSRSKILECPEVDDEVDPIPEKIKKGGNPDESDETEEDSKTSSRNADFSQLKKNQRLKGLGDKIDCFKAKFFGENPLDSPFFKEEIISNPEPVTTPNLPIYKLEFKEPLTFASRLNNEFNVPGKLKGDNSDVFSVFGKLKDEQSILQESLAKTKQELRLSLLPQNFSLTSNVPQSTQQSSTYFDVMKNIDNSRQPLKSDVQVSKQLSTSITEEDSDKNITYDSYLNKESVMTVLPPVRRKRATAFIYEPYKIIRDGQLPESKKTTTTGNISPLIKQMQSSKVIDKVTKSSEDQNQPVKRNVATRAYKDIGWKDTVKIEDKGAKDSSEAKFVDVSIDSRRREPRYEVRLMNHKVQYAPVENKKSMSLEDYESQTNKTIKKPRTRSENSTLTTSLKTLTNPKSKQRRTTSRPYFDVSQFLPKFTTSDIQKPSASNTIRQVVKNPTSTDQTQTEPEIEGNVSDDYYEEYDDEEVTTTTTSTSKPLFRKRRRKITTTTTSKPEDEEPLVLPKLRLITRFNTTPLPSTATAKTTTEKYVDMESPKYREKKKKSSKSTLVQDTKSYDDGNEDMMKDEVDAMIGVQHDMEEYKPHYEKEIEGKTKKASESSGSSEEDDIIADSNEEEDFDDEDDNVSDSGEEEDEEENEESDSSSSETEPEVTTPEPTKQTLVKTTEAPVSTTETRSAKLELKPIVHKKKIEIHKELPINKSSPHVSQYKQDYKEVEIIKEMPSKPKLPHRIPHRNLQKNLEALELFKDEKLAEEINKLGAVEVFKENLDLVKGPKHGGNYRSFDLEQTTSTQYPPRRGNFKPRKDAETSQTKNEKFVELTEVLPALRANAGDTNSRSRNYGRSARLELEETSDLSSKRLHGGNLKAKQDMENSHKGTKSAKLIELDEEENNDESADNTDERHDSSRSRGRPLHGGNYRSEKLVEDNVEDETANIKEKAAKNNHRSKSAVLLSSFAQAVPHLTTTPAYILDPSKRMYYYVDAKR